MLTGKMTSKGQITVPARIRELLKAGAGDVLAFDPVGETGTVVVRKATPLDRGWHAALETTLSEWASPEDQEDFDGL